MLPKDKIPILKTVLYDHQVRCLKFHMAQNKTADWSECGTGKSLTALGKFAVLRYAKLAYTMLVVCPLSVMGTWASEISKHTDFSYYILRGTLEDKVRMLHECGDVFIVTYDSLRSQSTYEDYTLLKYILDRHFGFIVCDEATMVKSWRAQRTRALTELCDRIPASLFLSGTPVTNDPTSIFTIYRAMDGGRTFGRNQWSARNTFFHNVGWRYPKWELRPEMFEKLQERLYTRAIRVTKEECLDLPPKIFTPRYCWLEGEQAKVYTMAANELVKELTLPEGRLNMHSILVKIGKLSQITGGSVYTDIGMAKFNPNHKMGLLMETLSMIPDPEQVVIFCRWVEEIREIQEQLKNAGVIYGDITQRERVKTIDQFTKGELKYLIAQESTGGYGINLQTAWNVVYYSQTFSVIDWMQSQDRIHRAGQKADKCVYYLLFAKDTIDEYIWSRLQEKVEIASALTNKEEQQQLKNNLVQFIKNN